MFLDPTAASFFHLLESVEFLVFKLFEISSMVIIAVLFLRPHWHALTKARPKQTPRRDHDEGQPSRAGPAGTGP
jgi:hypothetical protein